MPHRRSASKWDIWLYLNVENFESEINPRFYNSDTDTPFTNCMTCNVLLTDNQEYMIEKAMRRVPNLGVEEVIFEYAMCMSCAEDFRERMSKSSIEKIEAYFVEKSSGYVQMIDENNLSLSLDNCILTKKAKDECSEYVMNAHCRGDKMLYSAFPYMIDNDAMDEISEMLSAETLDELDDFKSKHFNGPPEIAELINPKRLIPI